MKKLLPLLALLATACSSSDTPKPAAPPTATPAVTYTDAAGTKTAVTGFQTYYVTATPVSGSERRTILVRSQLPNGSTLDVSYTYAGQFFPGEGPVTLNGPLRVDNYTAPTPGTTYTPTTGGTLTVVSASPRVISGEYAGPLVSGGQSVKLVFDKLTVPN